MIVIGSFVWSLQRTAAAIVNLIVGSRDFSAAKWGGGGVTIGSDATTSADGSTNADKLQEDGTTGSHGKNQIVTVVNGRTYTASVELKAAGRSTVLVEVISGATDCYASVNLTTGVATPGGVPSVPTVTSTSLGSGWHRISFTFPAASTTARLYILMSNGGGYSYAGDGSSSIYVDNAKIY